MSVNISLIRYSITGENNLAENKSVELDSTPLLEEVKDILVSSNYISQANILEEDSEEVYEIDIIDSKVVDFTITLLTDTFMEYAKMVVADNLSAEEEDKTLNNIRYVLNFRNILLEKKERYNEDNNILVVLN